MMNLLAYFIALFNAVFGSGSKLIDDDIKLLLRFLPMLRLFIEKLRGKNVEETVNKELFADCVDRITELYKNFENTEPAFYSLYKRARITLSDCIKTIPKRFRKSKVETSIDIIEDDDCDEEIEAGLEVSIKQENKMVSEQLLVLYNLLCLRLVVNQLAIVEKHAPHQLGTDVQVVLNEMLCHYRKQRDVLYKRVHGYKRVEPKRVLSNISNASPIGGKSGFKKFLTISVPSDTNVEVDNQQDVKRKRV